MLSDHRDFFIFVHFGENSGTRSVEFKCGTNLHFVMSVHFLTLQQRYIVANQSGLKQDSLAFGFAFGTCPEVELFP